MDADILYDAIGEIRDDFIRDAERKPVRLRRPSFRSLIAACITLFIIALPVSAEMRTGYVSNLLAPFYGGAQTEIVDSIGVPVGASATVGDYTLSADAVIGDRYNIAIVYSLTRTDGGKIPEGACFDGFSDWKRGGGGGGYIEHKRSQDGKTLQVIQQWTSKNRLFLFDRKFSVVFEDLVIWGEDGEKTLLAEGEWALSFTIRYEDTTVKLPVKNKKVAGGNGMVYEIERILLSPLGIHVDMTIPNPGTLGLGIMDLATDLTVSILLSDGTEVKMESANKGYSGSEDSKTYSAYFGDMFPEPIPMEQIVGIRICDTVAPVE